MSATDYEPALDLLADSDAATDEHRKRLLMIVNPYATTVSSRLRNLVIAALRGSFVVDAVDTERRDHATEICREAAQEGYDAVVAFGGDGTVNEAANGLAGTSTPLTCLPGGRANVYCRMLGIPADVIDATEHLLGLASSWRTRDVDLGSVQLPDRGAPRLFLFSAGVGLDASVVERVDAHPGRKARFGEYYYAWVAASTFTRRYLVRPPRMSAEISDARTDGARTTIGGVTVIVQNAAPYTYFGSRGVEMAEGASLQSGDLAGLILKRTSPIDVPSIGWRALSPNARIVGHRQIEHFGAQTLIRVRSLDDRELPVQVDGDFIGSTTELSFSIVPRALAVLA